MKIVVMRSLNASVSVQNKLVGKINSGLVLLVGFHNDDTMDDINYCIKKILNLRIFNDENNIMNKNVLEVDKEILSISQFTLYANTNKGNRPCYKDVLNYDKAEKLYKKFNELLNENIKVEQGIFGSDMKLSLVNDGPVTIIIESRK